MSFQLSTAADKKKTITGLEWRLSTDSNNPGIARIRVKATTSGDFPGSEVVKNPLLENSLANMYRMVDDYGGKGAERFIAKPSSSNQSIDVNDLSVILSERVTKGLSFDNPDKLTPGQKLVSDTLNSFSCFLTDCTAIQSNKRININQPLNASTSSLLLQSGNTWDAGADASTSNGETVAATLFQSSLQKCARGHKNDCFSQARNRLSELGALYLRNLFSYLCQDDDFVRRHVSDYTVNENLKCAIWRVSMTLGNMSQIAKALDEESTNVLNNTAATDYYQQAFSKLGNPAIWAFIVTAYRTSANGRVKLFISFVDDANAEYSENIAPMFSFIDGTFRVGYLNPDNNAPSYSSKKGGRRRFIGGTPFTVPDKQNFFGSVSLKAYTKQAPKPKVSLEFLEKVWREGSMYKFKFTKNTRSGMKFYSKQINFRVATMRYWINLVKDAGFDRVDELERMSASEIYEKLHPHIIVKSEKDCKFPLCSDTLTVLGFAGSTSQAPNTSEMTLVILRDLLSYFIGNKKDLAKYFFELEAAPRDEDSSSALRVMKNGSSIPFTNLLLVDLMIATQIFLSRSQLNYTISGEVEYHAFKIFGDKTHDLQALIRAYAATLSIPVFDVDVTSQEDLVMMIRTYDENVLAPVAGYLSSHDIKLRQRLDMVRVKLYRIGFSSTRANKSKDDNMMDRRIYSEKNQFMSLVTPNLLLGKRGYTEINDTEPIDNSKNKSSDRPNLKKGFGFYIPRESDDDDEDDDEYGGGLLDSSDDEDEQESSNPSHASLSSNFSYKVSELGSTFPGHGIDDGDQQGINPSFQPSALFQAEQPNKKDNPFIFEKPKPVTIGNGNKKKQTFTRNKGFEEGKSKEDDTDLTGASSYVKNLLGSPKQGTEGNTEFLSIINSFNFSWWPFNGFEIPQFIYSKAEAFTQFKPNNNILQFIKFIRTYSSVQKRYNQDEDILITAESIVSDFFFNYKHYLDHRFHETGTGNDFQFKIKNILKTLLDIVYQVNIEPVNSLEEFMDKCKDIKVKVFYIVENDIPTIEYKGNEEKQIIESLQLTLTTNIFKAISDAVVKLINNNNSEPLRALYISIMRNKRIDNDKLYNNLIKPTTDSFEANMIYPETFSYEMFNTIPHKLIANFLMRFKNPFFFPIKKFTNNQTWSLFNPHSLPQVLFGGGNGILNENQKQEITIMKNTLNLTVSYSKSYFKDYDHAFSLATSALNQKFVQELKQSSDDAFKILDLNNIPDYYKSIKIYSNNKYKSFCESLLHNLAKIAFSRGFVNQPTAFKKLFTGFSGLFLFKNPVPSTITEEFDAIFEILIAHKKWYDDIKREQDFRGEPFFQVFSELFEHGELMKFVSLLMDYSDKQGKFISEFRSWYNSYVTMDLNTQKISTTRRLTISTSQSQFSKTKFYFFENQDDFENEFQ